MSSSSIQSWSSDKWSLNVRLPQERDADYSSRCCCLLRQLSKCNPSFVCAADRHPATFKDLAGSRGEVGFRNLKLSDMGRGELQMLPGIRTHSIFQRLNFRACILEASKSKTEWIQHRNCEQTEGRSTSEREKKYMGLPKAFWHIQEC
jgi:hypothetical protein